MEAYGKDSNETILRWRQDLHEQEEWEKYEWKCIGCEKSLTHIHFDNDALMPYLEDPFSDQPSIPSYALLSEGDSSSTAQGLQDAECHQLLCNECKYDDRAKRIRSGGQPMCPIRSSRYIKYDSFLFRHFPGLADMLSRKEFTDHDPPRHWPTYMVRCAGCKKWKEIRHYLNERTFWDTLLEELVSDGFINLELGAFLMYPKTCDQCTDLQESNLSIRLALFAIWKRIDRLRSDYPGTFGEQRLIDIEKSLAYVRSVREEFETSGGQRGLKRERQQNFLDEEDIQKRKKDLNQLYLAVRS